MHALSEQEEKAEDKKQSAIEILAGVIPCAGVKYKDLEEAKNDADLSGGVFGASLSTFTDDEIDEINGYKIK